MGSGLGHGTQAGTLSRSSPGWFKEGWEMQSQDPQNRAATWKVTGGTAQFNLDKRSHNKFSMIFKLAVHNLQKLWRPHALNRHIALVQRRFGCIQKPLSVFTNYKSNDHCYNFNQISECQQGLKRGLGECHLTWGICDLLKVMLVGHGLGESSTVTFLNQYSF